MILNQQIRFTYKSLKRYIIEKHVKYLKYWDLTSNIVVRQLPEKPPNEHDKESVISYEVAKGETDSLKYFMKHVDSETAINILFASNNQYDEWATNADDTKDTQNEFGKLMDKYDIDKKEIIRKCYELLLKNMREYNFMSSYSRYNDSHYYNSSYHEPFAHSNRYDGSNRYYRPTSRFTSAAYHNEGAIASNIDPIRPYKFKPSPSSPPPESASPQKPPEGTEVSPSEDKRRIYRPEDSLYRSTRERYRGYTDYESRNRSYMQERHSYTAHRRSHRKSNRRSSSRRSRSRSRSRRRSRHH